jgi:hypothetical protein
LRVAARHGRVRDHSRPAHTTATQQTVVGGSAGVAPALAVAGVTGVCSLDSATLVLLCPPSSCESSRAWERMNRRRTALIFLASALLLLALSPLLRLKTQPLSPVPDGAGLVGRKVVSVEPVPSTTVPWQERMDINLTPGGGCPVECQFKTPEVPSVAQPVQH